MSLSVCAILKNEEENLPGFLKCFESVDEIILLDTGSTDSSIQIIRDAGIQVHEHIWDGNFSTARNKALQQCTKDWILCVDIDERIRKEDLEQLQQLLKISDEKAYAFDCLNLQENDWESVAYSPSIESKQIHSMHMVVRLFKNGLGIQYEDPIHESIVNSIEKLKIQFKKLPFFIYHTGYAGDLYQKKLKRNRVILDKNLASQRKNPAFLYYYCQNNWIEDPSIILVMKEAYEISSGKLKQYFAEMIFAWYMENKPDPELEDQSLPESTIGHWEAWVHKTYPQSLMLKLKEARVSFFTSQQDRSLSLYEDLVLHIKDEGVIQFFRPEILYHLAVLRACAGKLESALECLEEFEVLFGQEAMVYHQILKIHAIQQNWDAILKYAPQLPPELKELEEVKKQEVLKIVNHVFGSNHSLTQQIQQKLYS